MKKSLIALAVLAASGAAMAQSSVTLYGIADAYVGSKKTSTVVVDALGNVTVSEQRQSVVNSHGLNSSRWGLKGTEDLGGGLKGIFVLESGFNIDNGSSDQGGLLFGRQAFVGLGGDFGTLSLGRHFGAYDSVKANFLSAQGNSPAFDATGGASISPANLAGLSSAAPTLAQVNTTANAYVGRTGAWTGYQVRTDNSIRYETPNISGFKAAVVYGFGENKAPGADATKNASFSLTYANGPIAVALVHQNDELASDFHLKNTAIGGNYDFGIAKAFVAFNRAQITGLAKQNEWSAGLRAPLGATTLVAQYAQSKGDDLGKSKSLGLSAEYSLSKRTTAYAGFNQTKVDLVDAKNSVVGLGVRHAF